MSRCRSDNFKSINKMINFIKNFFGVEATAKNIRGKKSSGCEDGACYKHWRKENKATDDSIN